jgi:hypothetical protein
MGDIIEEPTIADFANQKITTSTLVLTFSGKMSTECAFQLLPILRFNIPHNKRTTKVKLPHCSVPGTILSMKYRGAVRGVVKSHKRAFKNSVTIDISIAKKNVNVKLSNNKMQICGATCKEDGLEASTYLIRHLRYIQWLINKLQDDLEKSKEIIKWILENTRGEPVQKQYRDKGDNTIYTKDEFKIVRPQVPIPEEFDRDVTRFL